MQQNASPQVNEIARRCITADKLLAHIATLASDEFQGRCPGREGEQRTLDYFDQVFAEISDRTGAEFVIQRQLVPTVEIKSTSILTFTARGDKYELQPPEEYILWSRQLQPHVQVDNAEVIFAGYGITAPEYQWNDFADIDVRGKFLIVLCGDPNFKGHEMTYYGRWTNKFEMAAKLKAAGILIVHETEKAGYGWDVVTHSFGNSDFELKTTRPEDKAPVEGWISLDAARRLFAKSGQDYESLKKAAQTNDFRGVKLDATATGAMRCTFNEVETYNFIATLPGSDPDVSDESVVYSAHWDHFGVTEKGTISGAVDNATGCAGVLALADAFASLPARPPRSTVFFLPTLEEQGLLGSRHYVATAHEQKILAVLNLEMLNPWGICRTVSSVCKGHSNLDELLDAAAKRQNRAIVPDPQPEKGYMYRSDHLPFMRAKIPGLALFFPAMDFMQERQAYIAQDYHKPSDKPKPNWNLEGAAADTLLFFDVGLHVLKTGFRAQWSTASEFFR